MIYRIIDRWKGSNRLSIMMRKPNLGGTNTKGQHDQIEYSKNNVRYYTKAHIAPKLRLQHSREGLNTVKCAALSVMILLYVFVQLSYCDHYLMEKRKCRAKFLNECKM